MSTEVQGHFFTIYFPGLYVLCFTRPRYQVSVYRTIGPLVSGWGNKRSSEKNLHHFCFWHPTSFNFYMVILSPGTNENFLPHQLKKMNPGGQPLNYMKNNYMEDL